MREALREAFEACGLPATMTWYTVSRHTYGASTSWAAGRWRRCGRSSVTRSVTVTERYAHLRPDLFKAEDCCKLTVRMSREGGAVIDLAAHRADGPLAMAWPRATLTTRRSGA